MKINKSIISNHKYKPKAIQFTGDNVSELLDWMTESGTSIVSNKFGKTVLHINKLVIEEGDYLVNTNEGVDVSKVIKPEEFDNSKLEWLDEWFKQANKK